MRQQQETTDDFGDVVYRCSQLGNLLWPDDVRWVGAIVPRVDVQSVIGRSAEAQSARRQSITWAREMDANCNTCRWLERVRHAKDNSGLLYGRCRNPAARLYAHPYRDRLDGDVFPFAPDDWQGMPCYEGRA